MKISEDGAIKLWMNKAEGVKFKLTNDVDVAHDGVIYFSDASHKYSLKEFVFNVFEGRPNGRLLSYHPSTKQTTVLVHDLYIANGVAVSSDQNFVVFCETPMYVITQFFLCLGIRCFDLNKSNPFADTIMLTFGEILTLIFVCLGIRLFLS